MVCTGHVHHSVGSIPQSTKPPDNKADPHKLSSKYSKAFVDTAKGQTVTCVAPPAWVWTAHAQMAGAWCIIATTLTEGIGTAINPQDMVAAGLIPVSTLAYTHRVG